MKKCPFCKADIEDNARFCLYCMKSLGDKTVLSPPKKNRSRLPLIMIGSVLLVVLVIMLLLPDEKPKSNAASKDIYLDSSPAESTQPNQSGETTLPEEGPAADTTVPKSEPEDTAPEQTEDPPEEPTESSPPPQSPPADGSGETPDDTPADVPDDTPTDTPADTPTEDPENDPTEPEQPVSTVVYSYRDAKAGDDFNYHYTNPGDHIVITGVAEQSPDGVYDIPAYIDGKKVIAITKNAFSGSNAKVVYIPATMKTIWNYAFAGCQVTDVYFRGSSVYMEGLAFVSSEVLTIHCSADCSDRNFRYYKNYPAMHDDIFWEEWSG